MKRGNGWLSFIFVLIAIVLLQPVSAAAQGGGQMRMRAFGQWVDVPLVKLGPDPPDPWDGKGVDQLIDELAGAMTAGGERAAAYRIAVFPFNFTFGERGKKPEKLSNDSAVRSLELQGALISAIRRKLGERAQSQAFRVLDKFALERAFSDSAIDPLSISPDNDELPALLEKLKIDAAIVGVAKNGGRDPESFEEFNAGRSISFQSKVVFSKGRRPVAISGVAPSTDMATLETNVLLDRFDVGMYYRRNNSTWTPIQLVTDKNAFGFSEVYAILPRDSVGMEYKLRIACRTYNSRSPSMDALPGSIVNVKGVEESNRLFGVAVLVDGVNSIYEKVGASDPAPLIVHPRDATKWIMCRPGYLVKAAQDGSPFIEGPHASGPDHSLLEIEGFQINGNKARVFKLANVGKNEGIVAETLGITDDIGLISMFFFSEKLDGDRHLAPFAMGRGIPEPKLGTAAGREVTKPTVAVNVKFHKKPVHQIHILYRLDEDCPIPPENRRLLGANGR